MSIIDIIKTLNMKLIQFYVSNLRDSIDNDFAVQYNLGNDFRPEIILQFDSLMRLQSEVCST